MRGLLQMGPGPAMNINMILYIVFIVILTLLAVLLVCNRSRRLRAARRQHQAMMAAAAANGHQPTLVFVGSYPAGMRPAGLQGGAAVGAGAQPWASSMGATTQPYPRASTRTPTPAWLVRSLPTFAFHASVAPAPAPGPDGKQAADADDEKEQTCAVCCCEYEEGEQLKTLPCLHSYHVQCIDSWLAVDHFCPICKHSLLLYSEEGVVDQAETGAPPAGPGQPSPAPHPTPAGSPLAGMRRNGIDSRRQQDQQQQVQMQPQAALPPAALPVAAAPGQQQQQQAYPQPAPAASGSYPALGQPAGGFMAPPPGAPVSASHVALDVPRS